MNLKHPRIRLLWSFSPGLAFSLALTAQLAAQQPVDPSPEVEVKEAIAPEVQRIQQALGGPAVNQFPLLQPNASPKGPATSQVPQRRAIEALREAASQLDSSANRLERLELYRQADALRQQAQQLRMDARELSGGTRPNESAGGLRPWEWGNAPPARPAEGPVTSHPNNHQNQPAPTPPLQPTPQPE